MQQVAVDVGGTFTDAIALAPDGEWRTRKTLTTPERIATGFLSAVQALDGDGESRGTELLVHGTTVILNAILTGRYGRAALVTTAGFRDALEIMRGSRKDLFNLWQRKPAPLIPRSLRFEVRERISAAGAVVEPLASQDVERVVAELARLELETVAVCFLYSFVNPAHERAMGEAIREALPDLAISLSHDVLPVYREFERTSTTVVNAIARPLMEHYLGEVVDSLAEERFDGDFLIMQSSGGLVEPGGARERPVFTFFSGPAGGVVCAMHVGRSAGFDNVINFDMGGTSCDVAAVTGGEPDRVTYFEVAGYPVQVPSLDIVSVGAGGGSIAWLDAGGALNVGPISAGAVPGPACYARGGREPTVTDAAVVLGRYNPHTALGGELPIDAALAAESIERLCESLDLSLEEAAWGILRLVNANMANALREVSVERGRDPRDYVLVAAGGAGPAHAFEVAEELGMGTILVPPFPGVASAQGMLLADLRREQVQTLYAVLSEVDEDEFAARCRSLAEELVARVRSGSVPSVEVSVVAGVDLRYRGQTYELTVPLAADFRVRELADAFHGAHERRYGHAFPDHEVELLNLRMAATGRLERRSVGAPTWPDFDPGSRPVFWGPGTGWLETPVLSRPALESAGQVDGPAVVEQADATVIVPPGATARAVAGGCLLLTRS